MSKSIVKRLVKIESSSRQPRWKAAVYDESTNLYTGQDIGGSLTVEAFNEWYAKQDTDTQVIIIEVCENIPTTSGEKETVTFKVENNADKNTNDLLKEYEESLNRANEANLLTAGIDGYSEQEKTSILDAYKIIRQHHPAVPREGMH